MKEEFNVLVRPGMRNEHIRVVVHKDINEADIDYFVKVVDHVLNQSELRVSESQQEVLFRNRNLKVDLTKFEISQEQLEE